MKYDEVKLEFKGFEPEFEIKKRLSKVIERIHYSAPSDSAIQFVLNKGKDAIQATCRIASSAGTFIAEVASHSPTQAIHQIEEKIKNQLERWKNGRFKA